MLEDRFNNDEHWDQETVSKVWKELNDLASKDPKEYQAYIKKTLSKARKIIPGFVLEFKRLFVLLNVCQSDNIARNKDNENVNVVMGTLRKHSEGYPSILGETWTLVDVVFSRSTLDRAANNSTYHDQLCQLIMDCVLETYSINLHNSPYDTRIDEYVGDYTWNDKTGRPLTEEELRGEVAVLSPDELLLHLKSGALSTEDISNYSSDLLSNLSPCEEKHEKNYSGTSSASLVRSDFPPKPPVICEIRPEPSFEISQDLENKMVFVTIMLPGVVSASLLDIFVLDESNQVQIVCKSKSYDLIVTLPGSVCTEDGSAKFLKGKESLVLQYPLRGA